MSENNDIVEYGEWTDDEVSADIQYAARLRRKKAALEEGQNVWRFLPGLKGQRPFYVVSKHYIDKPGGDGAVVIDNCPRAAADARCPVCEHAEQLLQSGNPYDAKMAERLSPVPRAYWCGVNIGSGLPPSELVPEIIELPFQIHQKLLDMRKDPRRGNFTDPNTGFDILITRTGTGFNTRYGDPQPTMDGRKPLENMNWLSQIKSFSRYAQLPSREVMGEAMEILRGQSAPSGAMGMRQVGQSGYTPSQLPPAPPAKPAPVGPSVQGDLEGDDVVW